MNSDTNFQKYEHEKQKELNDKNYQRGYEDGLISAGQKAYENGFREGVQVTFIIIITIYSLSLELKMVILQGI